MRSAARALAAAGVAVALAAPTAGAPATTLLDPLRGLVEGRLALLSPTGAEEDVREFEDLTRALAAFERASTSLDGDVRIFARAAKAIEHANTTDAILNELAFTLYDLSSAVAPDRDALAARIDALVAPRPKRAAQVMLADVDVSLNAAAVGVGMPSARAKSDLRFAIARIAAANAKIDRATACRAGPTRPGRAYLACFADGTAFVPRFGGSAAGAELRTTVTGYGLTARDGAIEISWDTGAFTGAGTYDLDGSSGAMVVLVADGETFASESGSVVVTNSDPGTHRIEGTFSGTVASGSGARRLLTSGVFTACYAVTKR